MKEHEVVQKGGFYVEMRIDFLFFYCDVLVFLVLHTGYTHGDAHLPEQSLWLNDIHDHKFHRLAI
jgi:hypothetical protein